MVPIFDPRIRRGTINVGVTPGELTECEIDVFVEIDESFSTFVSLLPTAVSFNLLVSTTGDCEDPPIELEEEDVTVTGDTEGTIYQFADFVDPIAVLVSGLREWGDIDLDVTHPDIDTFGTDGPHVVQYPYLIPGYVNPTSNINVVGVCVISDYRIAATREAGGGDTYFMILDTTDKNQPAVVSETLMGGYPWGAHMLYDPASDRVYVGASQSGCTVMDISDQSNPVQGDLIGDHTAPCLIGTDLIIGADKIDNHYGIWDTSNINVWTQVGTDHVDATNFADAQQLIYLGGDRVLGLPIENLVLIDVTTPASPSLSVISTATALGYSVFSGMVLDPATDIVYVTGQPTTNPSGLSIRVTSVDVSTPSSPSVISSATFNTGELWSTAEVPRVIDGDLWVFGNVQKLARVDISNPSSMTMITDPHHTATYPSQTDFWCRDTVAIQDGYAWAVSVFSTLIGIRLGTGATLPPPGTPTGGVVTEDGGYTYHTFNGSGLFRPNGFTDPIDWFGIAGGGAGGTAGSERTGGGGGAGEYDDGSQVISSNVTISIGAGGTLGSGTGNGGGNTNASGGLTVNLGGGAGGGANGSGTANGGSAVGGGSGGGAQHGGTGGTGTFNGGNGYNSGGADNFGGGGGGGTSGNGQAAQSSTSGHAGDGGNGAEWPASSGDFYGGGGGGGAQRFTGTYVGGSGGSGVGGDGGTDGVDIAAVAPAPNTGSGGAGGAFSVAGTAGAAGVFIFRYPTP
jgi:hypothetical protein